MDESIIEITSFTNFVSALDKLKNPNTFFRGQSQDWPLLPKIARYPKLTGEAIMELEKLVFFEFVRRGRPFFQFETEVRDEIEILTIGQHYGLPTRLMDWTTNPLAALWFAVKDELKENSEAAVVWIYDPKPDNDAYRTGFAYHPFEIPRTLHFKPVHVDQRLIVQKSTFTIHGSGENNEEKRFIPMQHDERIVGLKKIVIPSEACEELTRRLELCGIDESSMFPGLDGLCRQIEKETEDR